MPHDERDNSDKARFWILLSVLLVCSATHLHLLDEPPTTLPSPSHNKKEGTTTTRTTRQERRWVFLLLGRSPTHLLDEVLALPLQLRQPRLAGHRLAIKWRVGCVWRVALCVCVWCGWYPSPCRHARTHKHTQCHYHSAPTHLDEEAVRVPLRRLNCQRPTRTIECIG